MLFSELYSTYYHTVSAVLTEAIQHPLDAQTLRQIVDANAFGESGLRIIPALQEEEWPLLKADGTTPIENEPLMPLTTLEKRWINAISADPRMRLFTDDPICYPDVEPLFRQEDYQIFDQYADGDPYDDESYIANFRLILDAIRQRYPIKIEMQNHSKNVVSHVMLPEHLEYSEKDDKFRITGTGSREVVNLARIIRCCRYEGEIRNDEKKEVRTKQALVFELTDRRNALERVLMHFSHFEKEVLRIDDNHYKVRIFYDGEDETEMVIRVLSFGPMIKVISPQSFVNLMKRRLQNQMHLHM